MVNLFRASHGDVGEMVLILGDRIVEEAGSRGARSTVCGPKLFVCLTTSLRPCGVVVLLPHSRVGCRGSCRLDDGKILSAHPPYLACLGGQSIHEPRKYETRGRQNSSPAPTGWGSRSALLGASRLRVFIDFDYPATFAGKLAQSAICPDLRSLGRQPDCQFPALPRYNVEQSSSASSTG